MNDAINQIKDEHEPHEPHTGGHDSNLEDEDEDKVTETCLPVQVAGKHTVP